MKQELIIKYYKVPNINAAIYNPRKIEPVAKSGLSNSLDRFSLLQPLIVNTRGKKNILISGHRRLEDLKEKGFTEVPVVEVDLSEADEKLLNLSMNNLKIQGYFSDEVNALVKDIRDVLGEDIITSLNLDHAVDDVIDLSMFNKPEMQLQVDDWKSDIEKHTKTKENLDGLKGKITITCKSDDYDAVLIYLKAKLMETSFEGVHIE